MTRNISDHVPLDPAHYDWCTRPATYDPSSSSYSHLQPLHHALVQFVLRQRLRSRTPTLSRCHVVGRDRQPGTVDMLDQAPSLPTRIDCAPRKPPTSLEGYPPDSTALACFRSPPRELALVLDTLRHTAPKRENPSNLSHSRCFSGPCRASLDALAGVDVDIGLIGRCETLKKTRPCGTEERGAHSDSWPPAFEKPLILDRSQTNQTKQAKLTHGDQTQAQPEPHARTLHDN